MDPGRADCQGWPLRRAGATLPIADHAKNGKRVLTVRRRGGIFRAVHKTTGERALGLKSLKFTDIVRRFSGSVPETVNVCSIVEMGVPAIPWTQNGPPIG